MGSIVMEPEDIESYARIYHPGRNYSSICLSIGMVNSRGLFYDTNPLDYSVPLLLAQLALASSVILFTTFFLKPLGQPSMVMQIVVSSIPTLSFPHSFSFSQFCRLIKTMHSGSGEYFVINASICLCVCVLQTYIYIYTRY